MCVPAVWVDTTCDIPADLRLPAGAETLLFRVARECLHNVRKHAAASRVAVTLAVDGGTATLTVTDDGRGFEPDDPDPDAGLGLRLLADLVTEAGGRLRGGRRTRSRDGGARRGADVIRLALADDHAIVRSGLSQLLGAVDDFELVGIAATGHEIVALIDGAAQPPDVVLMDLEMPGVDGIEATRRILAAHPRVRIVILTSFADRDRILDALDAGAAGYLLKDAEPDELVRGVRAAAADEAPLAPRAASEVLRARRASRPAVELSERERDVLRLVGQGLPNKVIGLRLGITEKTVKAHLTRIFERIGVTDRTQAALWVQRNDSARRRG